MLLRPSNTLLLDEPTNHLDLDSKDVLLEALEDYGGTLIIVSHDRYFVEKLATKIIEIGHGEAIVYPGTYPEFLWSKANAARVSSQLPTPNPQPGSKKVEKSAPKQALAPVTTAELTREQRKQVEAERRRKQKALESLQRRIAELEGRIADREARVKELEAVMSAPGFYEDRDASKEVIDQHQTLMWEVGDLMGQWEALQEHATQQVPES
jgi:ATP-binding cassette subfamily F protein 3